MAKSRVSDTAAREGGSAAEAPQAYGDAPAGDAPSSCIAASDPDTDDPKSGSADAAEDGRGPETAAVAGHPSTLLTRESCLSKAELVALLKRGEQLHEADIYEELLERVQHRRSMQPSPLVLQHPSHHTSARSGGAAAGEGGEEGGGISTRAAAAAAGTGPRGTVKREVIYERVVTEEETEVGTPEDPDGGRRLRAAEPKGVKITCFKDDPEWAFQQFAGKCLDGEARFDDSLERLYMVKEARSILTQQGKSGGLFFSRETPQHRYTRLLREVPEAIIDAKEFSCQMAALADLHRREEAQLHESDAFCVTRLNAALEKTRRELAEHVKRLFAAAAFPLDKLVGDKDFALSESGIAEEEILNPLYCPSDGLPLQNLAAGARSVLCSGSAAQRGRRRRLAAVERKCGAAAHADAAAGGSNYAQGASAPRDAAFPAAVTDVNAGLQELEKAADAVGDAAAGRRSECAPAAAAASGHVRGGDGRAEWAKIKTSRHATDGGDAVVAPRDEAASRGARNMEVLMRIQNPARNVEAAATELDLRTRALQERLDALCRVVWGDVRDREAAEIDAAAFNKAATRTEDVGGSAGTAAESAVATPAGVPRRAAAAALDAADAAAPQAEAGVVGAPEAPVLSAAEARPRPESENEPAAALVESSFFRQDLATQLQQLHALVGGEMSDKRLNGLEARLQLLKRQLEEQHDSLQQRNQERARHRQRQHQRKSEALAEDELNALPDEWLPEKLVQKMHEALAPLLLPRQTTEKVDQLHEKLSDVFASQKQVVQLLLRLNRCEKQNSAVQASVSASLQLLKNLDKGSRDGKPGDESDRPRHSFDDAKELRAAGVGGGWSG